MTGPPFTDAQRETVEEVLWSADLVSDRRAAQVIAVRVLEAMSGAGPVPQDEPALSLPDVLAEVNARVAEVNARDHGQGTMTFLAVRRVVDAALLAVLAGDLPARAGRPSGHPGAGVPPDRRADGDAGRDALVLGFPPGS